MTMVRFDFIQLAIAGLASLGMAHGLPGQLTNMELAKSHTEMVPNLDIVVETRVTQQQKDRFASITVYTKNDFVIKKLDEPLLRMGKIPFPKILETRNTLAEVMVVLAEYGLGGGQPVEFKVDFALYGAEFKLTQKGLIHPRAEMERLERLERALGRLSQAEERFRDASEKDKTEAEITLIRAKKEINVLKRNIGQPIQDHEILYTHQKSMLFFNALMNGLDKAEGVAKLLDKSAIQQINSIKGIKGQQDPLVPSSSTTPVNRDNRKARGSDGKT
jgi:hypothetical protein